MSVLGDVGWQIVQDDVSDIGDIETSSGDSSSDEDRSSTTLEGVQSGLSLSLGPVSVNRGSGVSVRAEEVAQHIGHSLGLYKDEDQTARLASEQQVEQERSLVAIFNILDSLSNVFRGGTDSTDREENVVLQEGSCEHLDLSGESCGKHECLSVHDTGHVGTFDNLPDLRLETHVEHPIGLVKDKVLDVGERDLSSVNQVDQSTRSSRQEVTASFDSSDLGSDIGTTVDDGGSDPRSVGEFPCLVVDLRDEFSGRGEDEGGGVGLSSTVASVAVAVVYGGGGRTIREKSIEDGKEETGSLTGTSLGTSHQVSATGDNGDRVFLNGSRGLVSSKLNVVEQCWVDGRLGIGKDSDGLGDVGSGSLDGDIGILVKVDTSVLIVSNLLSSEVGTTCLMKTITLGSKELGF